VATIRKPGTIQFREITTDVLFPPKPNEFNTKFPRVMGRSVWFKTTPEALGSAPIVGVAIRKPLSIAR
jgi:hypothetical protein